MAENILEMRGIQKSFPGVKALKGVDLFVRKGEVHCLMGENGAGKSTLIKILAGLYSMDAGTVLLEGKTAAIDSIHTARELGLEFIHQELSVVNSLTVEENMTLGGREVTRFGVVNRRANRRIVQEVLDRLELPIKATQVVEELSVSQKQMMLIAKALSRNAKLIVLDEPTASLTDSETERLFRTMLRLKQEGVTFLYVSHRMNDIFTIGDRITVFRDGKNVSVLEVGSVTEQQIIRDMVGHSIEESYPYSARRAGEVLLELKHVSARDTLKDVSLTLHRGEILGISGLAGAGKTELARVLFGDNPLTGGQIILKGRKFTPRNPRQAIRAGMALIPEERRSQGIVAVMSVRENISLASGSTISAGGIISKKRDCETARRYMEDIHIKTPSAEQQIQFLSGGNQQKCVVSKWLNTAADIILMDEPTRGIDVGAKREIYDLMNQLTKAGKSVIVFSSEMPELMGMCDRIVILHEGRRTGEVTHAEATQERIMQHAIGGSAI